MLNDSQIARLLDIANAGCHKGLVTEARAVYEGILALRPGHTPARIGRALSHIVVDEFADAEAELRDILEQNAEDRDAAATLGLCLFLAGRKDEARNVLESLTGGEDTVADLASTLLEQM